MLGGIVKHHRRVLFLAASILMVISACSSSSSSDDAADDSAVDANALKVTVVSTRPDMVTGGDALLDIAGGSGTPSATVGGKAAELTAVDKWWRVIGLPEGKSTISVTRGEVDGAVEVTNYPVTGPVFSGPHLPLLDCTTDQHGLGKETDKNCSAPTTTETTDTVAGKQLKFPIEREKGVINRAIYWIDKPVGDAWNGRLIYRYGGGCGTSFGQGAPMTAVDAPGFLESGYAVATATFNTFQVQCNDVLSAETTMMVKERFIERFGVPVHTIGEGASGGAIQQHLILQNYPGLLDASLAILPFPDAITISAGVSDCGLLNNYYAGKGSSLTDAQRTAINGHAVPATCRLWESSFLEGGRPEDGCASGIPKSEIYNAQTNPKGLRCALPDANVNQFGRDSETGFAQRALDNVGVQYGLVALEAETITVDQFLDLNEAVGGYDVDGKIIGARTVAPVDVLERSYGKGRVSVGGGDQKKVPIINFNIYADALGDIHDRFRAFSLRDRLDSSPNHVIWTRGTVATDLGGVVGNIVSGGGGAGDSAVAILDEWLADGKQPANARDNCVGVDGVVVTGPDIYEKPGPCRDNFPLHDDPRTAAGAPLRNDILKCQLAAIDVGSYGVSFTPDQEARLRRIFSDGVCDWTKPSVGFVELEGTWLRY